MPDSKYPYATYLNVAFPALAVIDVPSLIEACTDRWYSQTLCNVDDSVVRLGVVQGESTGTSMPDDEFFFVLDGQLLSDLEGPLGRPEGA